jgi:L-2-hydroxyglutarate oxidase LhgO
MDRSQGSKIVIVGAGIVGLATAWALQRRFPGAGIRILEKETAVGRHQTGHNSGVIHAGIYYKPGSYKATLCVRGVHLMKEFCGENGIRFEACGKVIVASDAGEIPRLEELRRRGTANGVPGLEMVGSERLREIEPRVRAVQALLSPATAIVSYAEVGNALARSLVADGVDIRTGVRVRSATVQGDRVRVETDGDTFEAAHLINCAGLYSDTVARSMGLRADVRIVPFRGEYYTLRPGQDLVRGLIYPVPDPNFPFLGVHFTKRIDGTFEAGPNAVLAFAREGYTFGKVHAGELAGLVAYRGFWAMGARYWRTGFDEFVRSLSKTAFTRALQKLVPDIAESDLVPGGSGVRAQAVARDGSLVDDFAITTGPRSIHVLNAPSPAATASLAIGEHIAAIAAKEFDLQ